MKHIKTIISSRTFTSKRTTGFLLIVIMLSLFLFKTTDLVAQTSSSIVIDTSKVSGSNIEEEIVPNSINPGDEEPLPGPAAAITGTATITPGQTGVIYSVRSIVNATGYIWDLPPGASITSGYNTYRITVQFSSSASSGIMTVTGYNEYGYGDPSPPFSITVNSNIGAAGTITGTSSVCQGQNSVVYSVAPITNATGYTWTVPTGATIVSGSNTNSITVNYSSTASSGNVTVRGTNGAATGASSSYAVTVKSIPGITTQPSSMTVCSNSSSLTISVVASGSISGYQWYENNVAFDNSAPLLNGKTSTMQSVSPSYSNGKQYKVVVTGTSGCSITSNTATVTTVPLITTQPASKTVCAGDNTTFTVAATGTSLSYEWRNGTTTIPGATSSSYTVNNVQANSSYNVVVTQGSCYANSSTANLTVLQRPVAAQSIEGISNVLKGETGYNYFVPNITSATTYSWTLPTGASIASGAGTNKITVNYSTGATSGSMTVQGSNTVCSGTASPSLAINVVTPRTISNTMNYVRSWIVTKEGVTKESYVEGLRAGEVQESINYFDGLGRQRQSVTLQASPLKKDIITPSEYDAYGRESKKYLPYAVATENNGAYISTDYSNQSTFYSSMYPTDASTAFSKTIYEASPLNRVLKQGAPGIPWQPFDNSTRSASEHVISYNYETNTTEQVKLWKIVGSTVSSVSNYNSGKLYKTCVFDENNNKVSEYKDFTGNVVLKRVESESGNLDTYYVYDEYNRLRYVIPPLGIAMTYSEINDQNFNELLYAYHYDSRGRLIEKHIPGAGWQEIVYNNIDLPVLSRDQKQANSGIWIFTKYDVLGRPVITGTVSDPATRSTMQSRVDSQVDLWESRTGSTYTNKTYPQLNLSILTENYYDDYTFDTQSKIFQSSLGNTSYSNFTVGLLTGTKVKILATSGTSEYMYTITYYDNYSRPIQVWNQTAKGWDRFSTKYDFTGQVLNTERVHQAGSTNEVKISNRYVYDHAGRKKEAYQQMNSEPEVMLACYNYDELGQLIEKNIHQTSPTERLQSVDYRYNIRGWLTSINNSKLNADPSVGSESDDAFGMELYYNTGLTSGTITGQGQYNGNISGMAWKSKGPGVAYTSVPSNAYAFNYDKLNRLLLANYASSSTSNDLYNSYDGRYNESLTYDVMGNIKTLTRKGMQGEFDNLSYTYLNGGHKLGLVTDNTTDAAGFNDLNKIGNDYDYDVNGNLILDKNKGLGITYNMLNLPQQVTRTSDGKNIQYIYDATGRKLKKIYNSLTHFYVDGIEYSGDTLLFAATEEGRVKKDAVTGSWVYDYFLKDHLGNVRVVLTAQPPSIATYPAATMEIANSTVEETFYAKLPETRTAKPYGFDNTDNTMVAELSSSGKKQIGPSITLKVNAGDKLGLSTKSFYKSKGAKYNRNPLLKEMLSMLLDGLVNPTGVMSQTGMAGREVASTQLFGSPEKYSSTMGSIASDVYNNNEEKPKAFMVWMLFDNEFKLVKSSSGMLQVPEGADKPAKTMVQNDITMDQSGYFYAYLVNESSMNVYFDDFQVTYSTSNVLEENHYYPFGMLNAQLSVQPTDKPLNNYKYNGKELQKELNLEWLDYGARFYDAQVGRFHSIDPLTENFSHQSPFVYADNNPVRYIDLNGMAAGEPPWGWAMVSSFKQAGMTNEQVTKTCTSIGNRGLSVADIAGGFTPADAVLDITQGSIELANGDYWEAFKSGLALIGLDLIKDAKKINNLVENAEDVFKNRVKLQKSTKEAIKDAAPKTKDGKYIDPNTGKPIEEGQEVYGHKAGQEWSKYKKDPENQGKTRREVIKDQNDSKKYQIEDRKSNASHKYEQKKNKDNDK